MQNNIGEVLKVILLLQQNADEENVTNLETCDREFLGCNITTQPCNTRPIMLYTQVENGTPWSMPTVRENIICPDEAECSSVFRVEKVDGDVATFRVLAPNPDPTQTTTPYVSTNSFFTMNLNLLFVLRCLPDTYVNI